MQKTILTFSLLSMLSVISINKANAQFNYWEFGLMGGVSHYHGDLTDGWIELNETNGFGTLFLRYNFTPNFAFRGSVSYGKISGSDEHATDFYRRTRNLHFRSNITEFAAIVEYMPWGYSPFSQRENDIAPYVFGGVALFRFNPQAEINDEWVDLQPLGTEGQGLIEYPDRQPYSLTSFAIPWGAGIKFRVTNSFTVAFEIGTRKTFTGYLDDVSTEHVDQDVIRGRRGEMAARLSDRSAELEHIDQNYFSEGDQRGNPDNDDWYTFTGIKLSFNLTRRTCFF